MAKIGIIFTTAPTQQDTFSYFSQSRRRLEFKKISYKLVVEGQSAFWSFTLLLLSIEYLRFYIEPSDVWNDVDLSDSDLLENVSEILSSIESIGGEEDYQYDQELCTTIYNIINNISKLSIKVVLQFSDALVKMSYHCVKVMKPGDTLLTNLCKSLAYYLQILVQKVENIWRSGSIDGGDNHVEEGKQGSKAKKSSASSSKSNKSWSSLRLKLIEFQELMLSDAFNYLWDLGVIPETFLLGIWKYALQLLQDRPFDSNTSPEANICVHLIIHCSQALQSSSSSSSHNHKNSQKQEGIGRLTPISSAIVNSICQSENIIPLSKDISEICEHANPVLIAEILNEFGHMNMSEKSKLKNAVKNIHTFLTKLAETCPELMAHYISLIIEQLDCDVYGIRNALLESLGILAIYIFKRQKKFKTRAPGAPPSQTTVAAEDLDEEERRLKPLLRLYSQICEILLMRMHDVSSYTRSIAMKIWSDLIENEALEEDKFSAIAKLAFGRLMDKAVYVRKSAVSLLTTMLEHNPYGGSLQLDMYLKQKQRIESAIQHRLVFLQEPTAPTDKMDKLSLLEPKPTEHEAEDVDPTNEVNSNQNEDVESETDFEEIVRNDQELKRLQEGLTSVLQIIDFIEVIMKSEEKIKAMIYSKTITDVVEAMRFLTRAVNFGIKGSMGFLCSTFTLIWHQEESIKKQCVETFKAVFLTDGAAVDPQYHQASEMAKNLIHLCRECDFEFYSSLEQIITILMVDKESALDEMFMHSVWRCIKNNADQVEPIAADETVTCEKISLLAASLYLAAIVIKSRPKYVTERQMWLIIATGLSEEVFLSKDFDSIKAAARCVQNYPFVFHSADEDTEEMSGNIQATIPLLQRVISGACCEDDEVCTRRWFSACEECVHALFHINPSAEKCIATACGQIFATLGSSGGGTSLDSTEKKFASHTALSRLVFLVGQGALCSVVFTERLAKDVKAFGANKPFQQDGDETPYTVTKGEEDHPADPVENALEEEMGLVAAADAEHEKILEYTTEEDLVCNKDNLFGKFHPLIAYIVANEKGQFSQPLIRESAMLALCRLMSVSSKLTEQYLPLVFTVLERKDLSPIEMSSSMIALGDLAFRFPNALEPWTDRIYRRLSEKSTILRHNTLMVLTHLILNDMIKVKGQVSHIVFCLVDPCEEIRGLACLFFTELAKRSNNPVYNLLGDIIGTLSGHDDSLDIVTAEGGLAAEGEKKRIMKAEEFKTAMTFLLKFVNKDRQADSLLERLLMRMENASNQRQLKNLAFCISQLPITEKGVRRMIELVRHYKDSLHDPEIRSYLLTAVAKSKKGSKAADSVRGAVEEFELLVATIAGEGEAVPQFPQDDEELDGSMTDNSVDINKLNQSKMNKSTVSKANNSKKKKANKPKKSKKVVSDDDDEDDEEDVEDEEVEEEEPDDSTKENSSLPNRKPVDNSNKKKTTKKTLESASQQSVVRKSKSSRKV